jgi:hypothetical protein
MEAGWRLLKLCILIEAFCHLTPFFMYVFLGFSLALSGEVFAASIMSNLAFIHAVALSLVAYISVAVLGGGAGLAFKIGRVLEVVDALTVSPYIIRLSILYLLSLDGARISLTRVLEAFRRPEEHV